MTAESDLPRREQRASRPPCVDTTRREHRLGLGLIRLVGAVLTLTAVGVLVAPRDPNIAYSRPLVLVGLLTTACLATVLRVVHARVASPQPPRWLEWLAGAGMSVLGGVAAAAVGHAVRYRYGWDAAVLTSFSNELSTGGTLSAHAADYLSRYPNNIPLLALMNVLHAVGGVLGWDMYGTYLWFNAVCVTVVMSITFALVRTLTSTFAAFLAQAAVLLLMGLSPWVATPYTDLPAAPLILGGLALAVVTLRAATVARTVFWGGVAVVALALAFTVKTTPVTSVVALVCVVVVVGLGARSTPVRVGSVVVVTAVTMLFSGVATVTGAAAAQTAKIHRGRLDTTRTPPLQWWLANGLVTVAQGHGHTYYGSYSGAMVRASRRLRGDELQRWSDRELRRQLERRSAVSLAAFEVDKQVFNWGDGMFFAWGEGSDSGASLLLDRAVTARWVQDWDHPSGEHYVLRASLTNGLWVFLVLWCGLGLLAAPYRRETLLLAVALLAVTAFTLLFQGRSRYLFAYVPVLVVLAATTDPVPGLRRMAIRLRA